MGEIRTADELATKLLDEPNCDPDDELRILSRQLIRRSEKLQRLEHILSSQQDETVDLIHANRDAMLVKHEEAIQLIARIVRPDGDLGIIAVLDALRSFHPMHGESWSGWPKQREKGTDGRTI